jgi:hypothetical protein
VGALVLKRTTPQQGQRDACGERGPGDEMQRGQLAGRLAWTKIAGEVVLALAQLEPEHVLEREVDTHALVVPAGCEIDTGEARAARSVG